MTARLAAGLVVSAMLRRVANEGGSATVLEKGDAESGSILVLTAERGALTAVLERVLDAVGTYRWQRVGPEDCDDSTEVAAYLDRRKMRDRDLWVIELDIANAERFAAETTGEA